MVYFDASQVFASLLLCPLLNRKKNFFFHAHKDHFVEPSKSSDIGDINTGCCYRRTYKELVKKKGNDIVLPTVIAMVKTQVDTYGWMQMEPMTISHGLLKHDVRLQHSAMQILGYICRFAAHKPTSKKESDNEEEKVDGDIDDVADEDDDEDDVDEEDVDEDDVDEEDVDEEDIDEEDNNYDVADKDDVEDDNDDDNKEEDSVGEDDVIGSKGAGEVVAQPQTNKKKRRRYYVQDRYR